MNIIRILIALLIAIRFSNCKVDNALTTLKHLIDLDRLPHHITQKGCHQSENEQTGRYVHCSHACIIRATPRYQCTIARTGCVLQDKFDRFNFFELLYCQLGGQLVFFLPIALLIIFLIFRFIAATVDEYVAGGLTYIATGLNMSEQMAGVTLIALANGAGDVITAIVASGSQGGISYNIGALYGAGFFVCSFVIALTILLNKDSQPIQVSERIIYRDIGFYIIATILTIIFAIQSKVYWWSAVMFLLLYVIMVFVVYIQDRNDEWQKKDAIDKEKALKDAINVEMEIKAERKKSKFHQVGKRILSVVRVIRMFRKEIGSNRAKGKALLQLEKDEIHQRHKQEAKQSQKEIDKKIKKEEELVPIVDQIFDDHSDSSALKRGLQLQIIDKKPTQSLSQSDIQSASGFDEEDEEIPWIDKTVLQRADYLLEIPFDFIRKMTIPPCEKENFNKMLCTIWPFPGMIFLLWVFDVVGDQKFQIAGLVLACIISFIFYETQKDLKDNEVPSYFFWICSIGTVIGLMWTYILSVMLIDLLDSFVVIFQLNNTYMGLTILGVGNALPDALTTIALAKKGFAQMGLTGCYAGQLFGLLVGFGIAQLKQSLITGQPQDFSLFKHPKLYLLDIIVIVAQFVCLIVTSIFAIKNNMYFTRSLAYFGLIIYIVFFVAATGVQIYYIVDGVKP